MKRLLCLLLVFTLLLRLLTGELEAAQGRSVERRISRARLPARRTLDTFDWHWPKVINREQVQKSGVSMSSVYTTLQTYYGGYQINDFTISINDMDLKNNEIRIMGKGSKERIVYYRESTKNKLYY